MNFTANGFLQDFFDRLTLELNAVARSPQEKQAQPTVAVIESQSVHTGLPHSVKGFDGGKKIKGIKRYLAVDSNFAKCKKIRKPLGHLFSYM